MSIVPAQFRSVVVIPGIQPLERVGIPYTKTAADLEMAIAANETHLGTWLEQIAGPALGPFQQDPTSWAATALRMTPEQGVALMNLAVPRITILDQLAWNFRLAAAVCRVFIYYATTEPLPPDTKSGLWRYYKRFYNSSAGSATESQFMANLAAYSDLQDLPA